MADIIVNASTSLVNINSSNISPGFNQIVLLSSVNNPGAIVTIRDFAGFCSANRKIIISTTSDTQFLDGPQISSFEITTPYGFFTVSPRTSNVWTVLNSFAFGTQANATVSSLTVTGLIVSDRILNASTFSTAHVQTSSLTSGVINTNSFFTTFLNAGLLESDTIYASNIFASNNISTPFLNTSSLRVTDLTSTAILNTSSLFINGVNTYLVTSTSLSTNRLAVSSIIPFTPGNVVTVEGILRPSTIAINQTNALAPLDIIGPNRSYTVVDEFGGNCLQIATGKGTGDQVMVMGNSSNLSTSYIQGIRQNTFASHLILNPRGGNVLMGTSTEGGRVGIRKTNPEENLDVNGNALIGSNGDAVLRVAPFGNNMYFQAGRSNTGGSATKLFFSPIGSTDPALTIDNSNRRIGIGTTSPSNLLSLYSTIPFVGRTSNNPFPAQFSIGSESARLQLASFYTGGGGTCGAIQASDYFFGTDNATPLLLNPVGGYVGIGNAEATLPLDVSGATRIQGDLFLGANPNTNRINFSGTTPDGYYDHTVIAENKYGPGEESELLLFKGNDEYQDRVRVLASGGFQVDTGGLMTWPYDGSVPTATYQNAFNVSSDGICTASRYFKHPGSVIFSEVIAEGSFSQFGGFPVYRESCYVDYEPKQSGNVILILSAVTQPFLSGGNGRDYIKVSIVVNTATVMFNFFRVDNDTCVNYRSTDEPFAQGLSDVVQVDGTVGIFIKYEAYTNLSNDIWGSMKSRLFIQELGQ